MPVAWGSNQHVGGALGRKRVVCFKGGGSGTPCGNQQQAETIGKETQDDYQDITVVILGFFVHSHSKREMMIKVVSKLIFLAM